MKQNLFKPVLLAAPTAKSKMYAFDSWLESAMNLSYPNYIIRVFDNSADGGVNAKKMNAIFRDKYGENNHKFKAIYIPVKDKSVIFRMTAATEAIRQYAVNKRFDYWFSLETDITVPENIIEELMCEGKQVIGAMYDRDEGMYRKLCVQKIVKEAPDSLLSLNFKPGEELGFIDGAVKKVSSVGLGIVLIDMNVLKNIPFRYFEGVHPDQFFSETMAMSKVNIYSHTGIMAVHNSREWGIFGIDFK